MKTNTMIPKPMRTLVLMLLLAAVGFATGCGNSDHQSIFDVKGPVAHEQLFITYVTLYVSVLIFVCVGSMMIFAVFRFRHRGEIPKDTPLPPQTHGNWLLEVVLTVISIGLLVVIAIPTIPSIFHIAETPAIDTNALWTPASDAPVVVTVRGFQWWWQFTYENVFEKKIVTANELRIPTGKPVVLRLESADVIHSFWVPKLAGKVDVIPNQHNEMWLKADEEGMYWGQCAEYCGTSHANMRFRIVTMYPDEFKRWVLAQNKSPLAPAKGSLAEQGMQIFMKGPREGQACATCHTIKGTVALGLVGPDLTHVAGRSIIAAGVLDNNDADLREWLHDPGAVKPGNRMATQASPPLHLGDDEINALVAYLETLK